MGWDCYHAGLIALIAFVVGTKMLAAEADTGVGSLTGSKKAVWQWSRGSGSGGINSLGDGAGGCR